MDTAIKCKHCGEFLDGKKRISVSKEATPSVAAKSAKPGVPVCQQCGGKMQKKTISSGNCSGIVVAMIVFCVGILLTVMIPVVGWVLGPLVCIGALFMGGKRSRVWKCRSCGSVVQRA